MPPVVRQSRTSRPVPAAQLPAQWLRITDVGRALNVASQKNWKRSRDREQP